MKAFVSLPRGAVFDTFFTPDNIALAEQLGEIVWNDTGHRLSEAELAEREAAVADAKRRLEAAVAEIIA